MMRGKIQRLFVIIAGGYGLMLALHLILRVVVKDATWWLAFVNQFTPYYFLPLMVLLPLAMAFKTPRLALPLLMLLVIGAAAYGPRFAPRTTGHSGDTLRVVTFNVWSLNQDFQAVRRWLQQQRADMVLLQEVSPENMQIINEQIQDDYPYQSVPNEWDSMILSRYPILIEELLDVGDGWPTQHRVALDVNGQTMMVYNIHLATPAQETPHINLPEIHPVIDLGMRFNSARRDNQIHGLLSILGRDTNPYIVAGDFNTSDQSAIYGELAAVMGDSFAEVGIGLGTSWRSNVNTSRLSFLPPLVRTDYVWHSSHFRAVSAQQGPPLGSDHLPLVVTLELAL